MIRKAEMSDLECLASVEAACFPKSEAATREDFSARLTRYANHFLLLFEEGQLISFVDGFCTNYENLTDEMYERADMHDENGAWQMIFGVNTLPGHRKRGCASRLLAAFIDHAAAENRRGLVLTCKRELIPFYAKFGFVNEGVSESVHGNAVWYQMRLVFTNKALEEP